MADNFALKRQILTLFDLPLAFQPLYLENGFSCKCRLNAIV